LFFGLFAKVVRSYPAAAPAITTGSKLIPLFSAFFSAVPIIPLTSFDQSFSGILGV
jgi:hypothetical protein